jgi:hypothetical protein
MYEEKRGKNLFFMVVYFVKTRMRWMCDEYEREGEG